MEKESRYKELLKNLEKMKENLMRGINETGQNDQAEIRTTVYPMAKVHPLMIDGYPVFQFGYEGLIPTFKGDDYEYMSMVKNYYYRATFDSYDYSKLKLPVMQDVFIIFVHYFKDKIIRDLDNRNKKYIQDAIRHTRIIGDDHWNNVWNVDIGFIDDERNHVQVYVVERRSYLQFMEFLMHNHEQLKTNMKYLPTREEYEAYYLKEKQEEEAKRAYEIEQNKAKELSINSSQFY